MAKTPHRIFEIYAVRDEAIAAITPKNLALQVDVDMEFPTFRQLSVSTKGCIVNVGFVGSQSYGPETLSELNEDFSKLSQLLAIDSKVLIDFNDVEAFCAGSIDATAEFNKRLKNKGSRTVLCCISPNVLENFYPAR